ncbi:MAG: UDP-N-acetylglucosamine 2-epimerase [Butyrivibrio sp.]|nr:UDP-N-acetylglucosamine 2-epimerase [Butyrivibrio sp.]
MRKKITAVLDSRAEYGLLKNTFRAIQNSDKLELYIAVTGALLSERYGYAVKEIKDDGFEIWAELPLDDAPEDETRIPAEMGNLMLRLSAALAKNKPDIMLLLGDRYEMLAAAATATAMHIPIAHISGGESTEGAMDEQIRHAITKMAHIHFPGASVYADNIRKMGEESRRIYDVGDPGIENIRLTEPLPKAELEGQLGVKIDKRTLLVTYHPVTLERAELEGQMDNLLGALSDYKGTLIITYPNSDDGSGLIIDKWKKFAEDKPEVCLTESLGSLRYLSVMHYCGAVVGNSSSAIVEAPFLKVPVVNIGNRQKGRLMADSIICCGYGRAEIEAAIERALSGEFAEITAASKSLYGDGSTSAEIVKALENTETGERLLKKKLCWGE